MRRLLPAIALAAMLLTSCAATLLTEDLAPLATRLCNRHDQFVAQDEGAPGPDKRMWLSQSGELRKMLAVPGPADLGEVEPRLAGVSSRHDAYVRAAQAAGDPEADLKGDSWIRSSEILRGLIDDAKGRSAGR